MPNYDSLVNYCVTKPSYQLMNRAYQDYLVDSAPCKAGVTNQCAVRMSVALERCGFSLSAFDPQNRVHSGRARCLLDVPHVLGANELARYLSRFWGAPERFNGSAASSAGESLNGRTGVIYFDNCFRREAGGPKTGDHIDLWTGTQYYNQIIHVGAGGDAGAGTGLFGRSEAIWFFPLAS
ncbi:MAG: hypothetical protein KIS76_04220 [Pyrinomonadaceae bacterium]|nr:hypothetical protein [Pyrinomonadaceae bacterium]